MAPADTHDAGNMGTFALLANSGQMGARGGLAAIARSSPAPSDYARCGGSEHGTGGTLRRVGSWTRTASPACSRDRRRRPRIRTSRETAVADERNDLEQPDIRDCVRDALASLTGRPALNAIKSGTRSEVLLTELEPARMAIVRRVCADLAVDLDVQPVAEDDLRRRQAVRRTA
jgi:hypothetical protein